jgi:uncharacterized LabA/DUF88 family protein
MADREPKLAVLIDADNAPAADAAALFVEIAKLGEASLRRAYGDFSRLTRKGWNMQALARHAIQPHQQFPNTTRKNATDIAMVIDAMDLVHSGRFDGFCLVTSDSDFTRLAARIREQGLDVFGIGRQSTPESFRQACTRFIYTENFATPEPATPAAATPTPAAEPEPAPAPAPARLSPAQVVPRLRRAVDEIEGDAEGWVPLGRVGQILNNRYPDFDPRSYGYAKLSDLVDSTGQFEIDRSAPHLRMRPKPARPKRGAR